MFDVKKDRQSYCDLLRAPNGYHVESAVGTTYALDMSTMLALVIALSDDLDIECSDLQNPVIILQAIRNMIGKIVVFCEAGQIKKPANQSPLYNLLEKMIVQVTLPARGRKVRESYPAFHAKTWTIKYVNNAGDHKYRFVNLSRNLTTDRSWDISIALDSTTEKHNENKTQPLVDFLHYLTKIAPAGQCRQMLSHLSDDLVTVSFTLEDKRFPDESFDIIPIGIHDGKDAILKTPLLSNPNNYSADCSFHRFIVFSPFISSDMLKRWNDSRRTLTGTTRTLITRKSELIKLKPEDVNLFDVFCLKDIVVDGEEMISDDSSNKVQQDIHAKIYLWQKYNQLDLYIGSMNATDAAVYNNVEMLVHLRTTQRYLSADSFLTELFGGSEDNQANPFEKIDLSTVDNQTDTNKENEDLQRQLKIICRSNLSAEAAADENGRWNISISCGKVSNLTSNASIRPLALENSKLLAASVVFQNLTVLQLSSFYIVTISDVDSQLERVITIPTNGLPQNREDAIIQSVIHDRKAFIEYLAFLLTDDYLLTILEQRQTGSSKWMGSVSQSYPALYEKLLKAALSSKDKLKEIREITRHLQGTEVITEEFIQLFSVVCESVGINSQGV